jgi:competence protein ComEC
VVSVGEGNSYGHPHPEVLARYADLGIAAFRTDTQGDILIRSSGGEPSVEAAPLPF